MMQNLIKPEHLMMSRILDFIEHAENITVSEAKRLSTITFETIAAYREACAQVKGVSKVNYYADPDDPRLVDYPITNLNKLSPIARELAISLYKYYGFDKVIKTSDELFIEISGKIGFDQHIQQAVTEMLNEGCAMSLNSSSPNGHRIFCFEK